MMQSYLMSWLRVGEEGVDLSSTGLSTLVYLFIFILLVVVILAIIGQRRLEAKLKSSSSLKGHAKGTPILNAGVSTQSAYQENEPIGYAKRCPTCRSIFTDETLTFCLSDGSTLERVPDSFSSNDPQAERGDIPPTVQYRPDLFTNKKG